MMGYHNCRSYTSESETTLKPLNKLGNLKLKSTGISSVRLVFVLNKIIKNREVFIT